MKQHFARGLALAVAIAAAGCCSPNQGREQCEAKCPACDMAKTTACPQCGLQKEQCKCPATDRTRYAINTYALKSLIDLTVAPMLVNAKTGRYDDCRPILVVIKLRPETKDAGLQSVLESKDAMIALYCPNPLCPASRQLAERLTTLGYTHVLEYPQGVGKCSGESNMVVQVAK